MSRSDFAIEIECRMSNKEYRLKKEKKKFDLEDRLIDLAVRVITTAESRADFIHKMKVSLKELRETLVWLKMIKRAKFIEPSSKIEPLLDENNQLISIFVTSLQTAKEKKTS